MTNESSGKGKKVAFSLIGLIGFIIAVILIIGRTQSDD